VLSPDEFREKYPPEELEQKLLDRPVSSLRDIQYLYGQLYKIGKKAKGEFAPYLAHDS